MARAPAPTMAGIPIVATFAMARHGRGNPAPTTMARTPAPTMADIPAVPAVAVPHTP